MSYILVSGDRFIEAFYPGIKWTTSASKAYTFGSYMVAMGIRADLWSTNKITAKVISKGQ